MFIDVLVFLITNRSQLTTNYFKCRFMSTGSYVEAVEKSKRAIDTSDVSADERIRFKPKRLYEDNNEKEKGEESVEWSLPPPPEAPTAVARTPVKNIGYSTENNDYVDMQSTPLRRSPRKRPQPVSLSNFDGARPSSLISSENSANENVNPSKY